MKRRITLLLTAFVVAVSGLAVGSLGTQPQRAEAAAAQVPAAVTGGVGNAAKYGVTQYVAVLDIQTGQMIGSTGNIDTPVASESLVKLMIAAYYLRSNGGTMPASMNTEMWDMIVRSNNAPASKYWTNSIVPTIASAYGLTNTYNNPGRPGYWGATHVTARDMAQLMWRIWNDPLVNHWIVTAMQSTGPYDPDGYNQQFGFNTLDGNHGSKQGWGCDSYWVGPCSVSTMGWSDKVIGVVLQTAPQSAYNAMHNTATYTTHAIVNASRVQPPHLPGRDDPEGDFGMWLGGADGMTLYLDGWAFDGSDLTWQVPVTVTVDGAPTISMVAGGPSPGLNSYGIPYNHGFFGALTMPNTGDHQVCIYLSNTLAGSPQNAKCLTASVPENPARDDPQGAVSATLASNGDIKVSGWMFDPSSVGSSIPGWLTANGALVRTHVADGASPQLYAYGVGGNHGISQTIVPSSYGSHSACVYAINVGWGKSTWVGCSNVSIAPDALRDYPRGDGQIVSSSGGQLVTVGWVIDPNQVSKELTVMWTLDGEVASFGYANLPSDYLYAYGVPGKHAAFSAISASPGKHEVCLFAFNVGLGTDQMISCRTATVTA